MTSSGKVMRKYDSIIWDWNGTLLDDVALALNVVNELFVEYGVPALTTNRYREIFDFPVRLYYERAGLDLQRHDFNEISEKFCARFEERLHMADLFPDVPPVLHSIRDSGARQFVLSSTEHNALQRMMYRYGLGGIFEATQGLGDTLASGKVSAGRELVDRYKIDAGRTVMIGDTSHDAEVARTLGIDCLLLTSGHHSPERLSTLGLPTFPSLEALSANLL
jgi:phosphoglycolate phosphatase